jgi:hypothetical protein
MPAAAQAYVGMTWLLEPMSCWNDKAAAERSKNTPTCHENPSFLSPSNPLF